MKPFAQITFLIAKIVGSLALMGGCLALMFVLPWVFYALAPLPHFLRSAAAQGLRGVVVHPSTILTTLPEVATLVTTLCYEASIAWLVLGGMVLWCLSLSVLLSPFFPERK